MVEILQITVLRAFANDTFETACVGPFVRAYVRARWKFNAVRGEGNADQRPGRETLA